MYTTNAIERLNSGFRRLNRGRTVFPNAMALTRALYLAAWELMKKWTMPVRNWGRSARSRISCIPAGLPGIDGRLEPERRARIRSTPALTERRENAMFFPATAMGIRGFFASPSAVHFSISPTACQGQATEAAAGASAGVPSGSGNHLLAAVRLITEKLEHGREGLRKVNRGSCMPQMAEKTSPDAPPSCAASP